MRAVCTDAGKESAWLELASAMVAARLAQHPDSPASVREVLQGIAADEARHAAHGRNVVAWCVAQEGSGLAADMPAACRAIDVEHHVPHASSGLGAYGLAGSALWRKCMHDARSEAVAWLEGMTGAEGVERVAA